MKRLAAALLLALPTAAAAAPAQPAAEQAVVAAVVEARGGYDSAGTYLVGDEVRERRAKAICRALPPDLTFRDWIGTLERVRANADGFQVVSIEIAEGLVVRTQTDASADAGFNTLIGPSSPLAQTLATLRSGSTVRFSGQFFRQNADCISGANVTLTGLIHEPAFVARFTAIAPAE